MTNIIPTRVASIVFALTIAVFGVRNLMNAKSMDTIVPDYMPGGGVWVYVCGVCMILAAVAIVLNKFAKVACYLLALMLLIFVCMLHVQPALDGNPGNLLKDTAIAMGAIIIGNVSPR